MARCGSVTIRRTARDSARRDKWTCSYFVGQYYSAGLLSGESLTLSHIEFVTLRGLETLLAGVFDFDGRWFPDTRLVKKLTK